MICHKILNFDREFFYEYRTCGGNDLRQIYENSLCQNLI